MSAAAANALPVLDLRGFEPGRSERAAFLEGLRETARTLGFFYLAGHGIDAGLQRDVLALARHFFNLPEAEKLAIEMVKSPHFRDYTRAGWEHTRGLRDWREQLDVGTELPAVPIDPPAPAWMRLRGPNQWPDACRSCVQCFCAIRRRRPSSRSASCGPSWRRSASQKTRSNRFTRRSRAS
jgi:isopenicillin N synthase-like dioxygenase